MNKKDVTKNDLTRIRKLDEIARALRKGTYFPITRLTSLKSLCKEPAIAAQFCLHLAQLTFRKVMKMRRPSYISAPEWKDHKQLMEKALNDLSGYLLKKSTGRKERLFDRLREIKEINNQYQNSEWGPIRIIKNSYVLLQENALQCVLDTNNAGFWAYHTARVYTERYNPSYGTGLVPESAPMVRDMVDFWCNFYEIDL